MSEKEGTNRYHAASHALSQWLKQHRYMEDLRDALEDLGRLEIDHNELDAKRAKLKTQVDAWKAEESKAANGHMTEMARLTKVNADAKTALQTERSVSEQRHTVFMKIMEDTAKTLSTKNQVAQATLKNAEAGLSQVQATHDKAVAHTKREQETMIASQASELTKVTAELEAMRGRVHAAIAAAASI